MSPLSHKEYIWTLKLIRHQKTMLSKKDLSLLELYRFCDNEEQRQLLEELILRFNFLDSDKYPCFLNDVVKCICGFGYKEEESALVAFCHDYSADSSQVVLNDLKVPMAMAGYCHIKTINRFERILKEYNNSKGRIKHFIAVDEFVGSGHTLALRLKEFKDHGFPDATIDFVFLAGMSDAVLMAKEQGASVYAVHEMKKGISGFYQGDELQHKRDIMLSLEGKLAPVINNTLLTDHSLGYHGSEALFCRQDKNVPNNVFPVFWWKEDDGGRKRNTIFVRVQDGY